MYCNSTFPRASRACRGAFTLVEVMVVLVIIALLASVVTINVRGYLATGYQNTAKMEMRAAMDALETFQAVTGKYPTNEEGLEILATKTEKFPEPLLTNVPVDPWGNPYGYTQPGRDRPYDVTCYGADGRPGGEGLDADILCWNLKSEKK